MGTSYLVALDVMLCRNIPNKDTQPTIPQKIEKQLMIVGPNYLKVLLYGHEGFKNLPTLKFCGKITAMEDNINQVTKICTAVQHCESI